MRENNMVSQTVNHVDTIFVYGGVVAMGLMMPFGLWFVEQVLPEPAIVEELAKALMGWWVWSQTKKSETVYRSLLLLGLVFGISESMLYIVNVLAHGSLLRLGIRLMVTVPMHMITAGIQGLFWGKWLWMPGLGLMMAVGLHYVFNLMV